MWTQCCSLLALNMCTLVLGTPPQFEPFIHEPASPHVHHMLIYECSSDVDLSYLTDEQLRGGPCYTDPSVLRLTGCMLTGSVVAGWAVGGEVSAFRSGHTPSHLPPPFLSVLIGCKAVM